MATSRAKVTAGREPGKAATKVRRAKERPALLGPGLHAGTIELHGERAYRVRVTGLGHVNAVLDPSVAAALADECLREGRTVVLADTERGPTILGALQTSPSFSADASGVVSIAGKDIKLRAERALLLEAGPVSIRLDQAGLVRAEGERLVLDMASLVKILAARVELP